MMEFDEILNDPATVKGEDSHLPRTWGRLRLEPHLLAAVYGAVERATLTQFQSKLFAELASSTELLYGTGCVGSGKTFAACVFAVDVVMRSAATEGVKVIYFVPSQQDAANIKENIYKLNFNIRVSHEHKPAPDVLLVTLDNIALRITKTTVQASASLVSLVVIDDAEEMLSFQERRKNVGELMVNLYSAKENGVPTHLLLGNYVTDYSTRFYQEITQCINKQFKLTINPKRVEDTFDPLKVVPQFLVVYDAEGALVNLTQQRTRRLGKPCIVICQSSEQADRILRKLESRGHLAELCIEGPNTSVTSSQQIRQFNSYRFKFLICENTLPRHFAIEEACCVIIFGVLRDDSFNVNIHSYRECVLRAYKPKSQGFVLTVLTDEEQAFKGALERELGYALAPW